MLDDGNYGTRYVVLFKGLLSGVRESLNKTSSLSINRHSGESRNLWRSFWIPDQVRNDVIQTFLRWLLIVFIPVLKRRKGM